MIRWRYTIVRWACKEDGESKGMSKVSSLFTSSDFKFPPSVRIMELVSLPNSEPLIACRLHSQTILGSCTNLNSDSYMSTPSLLLMHNRSAINLAPIGVHSDNAHSVIVFTSRKYSWDGDSYATYPRKLFTCAFPTWMRRKEAHSCVHSVAPCTKPAMRESRVGSKRSAMGRVNKGAG